MPDIRAVQSFATLNRTEKQVEANTHDLPDWLELMLNELRRLRIGDTSLRDEDVLR